MIWSSMIWSSIWSSMIWSSNRFFDDFEEGKILVMFRWKCWNCNFGIFWIKNEFLMILSKIFLTAHQYLVTLKWIIRTWSGWFWALRFGMWKWISYDVAISKRFFFEFWTDSSLLFCCTWIKVQFWKKSKSSKDSKSSRTL